jgi:putative membrane protein
MSRRHSRLFAIALSAALLPAPALAQTEREIEREVEPSTGSVAPATSKEHAFAREAASGGMLEVELGKHAAGKAADPRVQGFGRMMEKDHGEANQELAEIARQQEIELPDALEPQHRETRDRLLKLEGPELDRAYMQEMVKDHRKDVSAFEKMAREGAPAGSVEGWAAKTLPVLRTHLEHAEEVSRALESPAAAPGSAR